MAGASLRTLTASSAYADEAATTIMRPSASRARHLIRRNVSSPRATANAFGRQRIIATNIREIKGFPAVLRCEALKLQHNFANMLGGLHAPMRFRCFFQRERAIHDRFYPPLAEERHHFRLDGGDHRRLIRITTGS